MLEMLEPLLMPKKTNAKDTTHRYPKLETGITMLSPELKSQGFTHIWKSYSS
jgi:hypothetical protein